MKTIVNLFLVFISYIAVLVGVVAIPVHIVYRLVSKKYDLWYYFLQIAVSNDVTAGSLIYGSKHTISAITGYRSYIGSKYHKIQEKVINLFFGKNHCFNEAKNEGLIKK